MYRSTPILLALLIAIGCKGDPTPATDADADADTDTDADSDTDADADTDADTDSDTDADTDSDTDTDTDTDPMLACDPALVEYGGLLAVYASEPIQRVDGATSPLPFAAPPTARLLKQAPNGTWYGLTGGGANTQLVTYDPCTGTETVVGTVTVPSTTIELIEGFAILSDGRAFLSYSDTPGFTSGMVGELDLTTAAVTGSPGIMSNTLEGDIDAMWADGTLLYGRDNTNATCPGGTPSTWCTRVVSIDPDMLTDTFVTDLPLDVGRLAADGQGGAVAFINEGDGNEEWLYTFDASWNRTPVADLDPNDTRDAPTSWFEGDITCYEPLRALFGDEMHWIDRTTGEAHPTGIVFSVGARGIQQAPDGTWYGFRDATGDPTLVTVDPCDGTVTDVASFTNGGVQIDTVEGWTVLDNGSAYVAGSLNGDDATSETLGDLDLTTAVQTNGVTVSGFSTVDVDGMFTDGTTIYANEATPSWTMRFGALDPTTGVATVLFDGNAQIGGATWGAGSAWAWQVDTEELHRYDTAAVPWTQVVIGPFDPNGSGVGTPAGLFWLD